MAFIFLLKVNRFKSFRLNFQTFIVIVGVEAQDLALHVTSISHNEKLMPGRSL